MPQTRVVVHINEDLCNGCGECVPSCAEGAIQIIDGKARLVGDNLCDGLGACLGHCPLGAITLEEREAAAFDEQAVERHLAGQRTACPGLRKWDLESVLTDAPIPPPADLPGLRNFPIQLHLVNPGASFFRDADLLIAADCVAFAMPSFHDALVGARTVVIGCPKLDDAGAYIERLAAIFRTGRPRSLTVARMEVPCCGGLNQIVRLAQQDAGTSIPVKTVVVNARGQFV